ncbi:MAG TPA: electron transport complex subunit RsxC [Candidatus Scatomonas merdigallinarum]|nr:electron transport complex subunit RsxC [Candidatus Scatomonas merdigallinarum]
MENYTKYKLKDREELTSLLADKDNLFLIACNKCFKEFETVEEPECEELSELAREMGKTVTGSARVDFLCNKVQTEKKLQDMIPEGTEHILVASCGLGIQTVADLTGKKVYAASNSLNYRGYHGMALTERKCDACAQCYLNITGGICPIVDCSKSLVNGQCGGAKDGKCEVDSSKDCAWEKIYRRLEKQGRLEEFLNQPVQLRDYSKVNFKFINDYVKSIRENRLEGYYGGVHPSERKEFTEHLALQKFPEPKEVVIPLSMHAGAPANPVVQVGDTVKVGQKIGEAAAFISSPVHSSVSGTVTAIEERGHATRGTCLSVVIRSDGKNTLDESVKPHKDLESLTPDEIVEIVKEAGIVGMGGAGFPTAVKLKPAKPVDTILLNGCECEPLLTADHRVLLEYADDVIFGLKAILKATGAQKGVIVIEDNKPDAIALMKEKTAGCQQMEVVAARTKYPQGAEKMLIKRVTGRMVPSGGLPADVGCIVSNISTTKAISDAIQKGMPLIQRVVTVTGERLKHPGNFVVKIGTNTRDLIDYCGGITGQGEVTVKAGGPMMGFVLTDTNVPIMKGSNGIIAVDTDHAAEQPCIKCGRCVDVCPMELSPLYFAKYADQENWQGMKDMHVMDCIECRSCEYICSSKIPLVAKIKAGKTAVRGMK